MLKVGDQVRLVPFWHHAFHVPNFWTVVQVLEVDEEAAKAQVVYLNGRHFEGRVEWLDFTRIDMTTIERS